MKFGIIGIGRFGSHVATTLAENGMEVIAIDSDQETINAIQNQVTQAICMRVTDEDALRAVGMEEMDTVIVAMGEPFSESILVTALLKKRLQIGRVIARANTPMQREILQLVGADQVILPEKEEAIRLAHTLSLNFTSILGVTSHFSVSQLKVPKKWVGLTVAAIQDMYNITCMGIRDGEEVEPCASATILQANATVIISGLNKDLEKAARL